MASLDVSAAFDSVSIELLMKGLTIIGHPDDVLCLIRFSNRSYYILINGRNSEVANMQYSTKKGSILGLFLYAL